MDDVHRFYSSLAKLKEREGTTMPGISVYSHCYLAGLVAMELMSRMPDSKRALFPSFAPLVAAIHDVGKLNPLFQEKLRRKITEPPYVQNSFPGLEAADPRLEEATGWHSGVGYLTLERVSKKIAQVVGSHHGSLSAPEIDDDAPAIGGELWNSYRWNTIRALEEGLGMRLPADRPEFDPSLLAGLTTVSDWIASGSGFDQYNDRQVESIDRKIVAQAVDSAGFVVPKIKTGLDFGDVFDGYRPNPTQRAAIDMISGPGVYALEAQMGIGKTEAALFAAYKMLEKGSASGIYFAMPTRLTSNKIFDRLNPFLHKILDPSDRSRVLLLHGKSWIYNTDMGESANPGCSWFDSRKRGLLAPFGVGTIDQALLSTMNVRHSFVRLFGLAGKVVILDEVHTYDAYTGAILATLVERLRHLDCVVIILSATLSRKQKAKLLGLAGEETGGSRYPLVTGECDGRAILSGHIPTEEREVRISYTETEGLGSALQSVREHALNNEQVVWIENTVDQAQEVFKNLASWSRENGIDCALLHSRYTESDRSAIENKWVSLLGKEGRKERRGRGRILVGTQVIEQSLDLDADFMVTRLAPSDMLLQRIGRLWRHRSLDGSRPDGAKPEVMVLAPEFAEIKADIREAFGATGFVYAPYVLYRTAEIWRGISKVSIPGDLRGLIDATYSEREEASPAIRAAKADLAREKEKLSRLATNAMSDIGKACDDDCPTRINDVPTCPVLLLRRINDESKGVITLLDGTVVDLAKNTGDMAARRRTARILGNSMLQTSCVKSPKAARVKLFGLLGKFVFVADTEDRLLRIGICGRDGAIRNPYGQENADYEISYNELTGYQARRRR